MNEKIKIAYENACMDYIREFEKKNEIDFDGWTGNIGESANFGDYYISMSDIVYVIDNDISFNTFDDWYWFSVEFELCRINLQTYSKMERDYKNKMDNEESWDVDSNIFKQHLIYDLLKKTV